MVDLTESIESLPSDPTLITDSIGFTELSYFAVDEEQGIFLAPVAIERRGFNNTPCHVEVIFFNPSYGYLKPEFPLRSNRYSISFGMGETGIKEVPVKIFPNAVTSHPLLLQILLELNIRSVSSTVNPLRSTSSLLISPKGLAQPALQKAAQSYYQIKGIDVLREANQFQRPAQSGIFSRPILTVSAEANSLSDSIE